VRTDKRDGIATRRDFIIRTTGAAAALFLLPEWRVRWVETALAQSDDALPGAAWQARHNLSPSDFQDEFNNWTSQGYRMVDISGYQQNGDVRYAAIWEQVDSPPWRARNGLSADDYQAQFDQLKAQGYHPVRVSAFNANGSVYYNGIWEQSPVGAWEANHVLSAEDYQATFNRLRDQGYRLIDVSGYELNDRPYYAAIFQEADGPAWEGRHGLSSAEYQSTFNRLKGQGYRMVHVSGYGVGRTPYYAGIWEKTEGPDWEARTGLAASAYQGVFDQWFYQGFRPARVCGYDAGGQTQMAAIFNLVGFSSADLATIRNTVNGVMQKHKVPGAAIAFAKDGRLVYAGGFGKLDSGGHEVSPTNVFRLASISKAITAVTILSLVEQQQFNLTDTVFGDAGILGTTYGSKRYTANMRAITVDHLLHHTSGGWDKDHADPMFRNNSYSHAELIGWVLDNTTDGSDEKSMYHLDRPGAHYAYSNFGYCLLGRVIEAVTGQSYATYVQQNILSQCGITDMDIAGNTLADRRPDEAEYFGGNAYDMNVARMDSHGGWIASAIDYVRFIVRVDGFDTPPDILQPASIATMTTGSSANPRYAMGWELTPPNWWHNGSLPGTTTIMVRTPDGFCWAALFNTRASSGIDGDQDQMMWTIHDSVTAWPSYDLF